MQIKKQWALLFFTLSLFTTVGYADQTGDCTAGEQYCEQNSLTTTNATTTTNTNTNVNTNANTNVNTNTSTNTNVNTNSNTNVNANTNVNTSTATNTNVNTNSNTNVNANTNNNTNTSNNTNVNTNTSNATTNNTNNNVNTSTSTNNSTVNQTVNNTSTSNNTNNNNNNNTSVATNTNNNNNVNTSTSDSNVTTENTNSNTNNNNSVSDNTNRNINESNSTQTINQNVTTKAPPASAIAPSIMSYSQDLCTVGRSGAYQGQVFGFSTGGTVTDENCERLKLSKYLYDTGMKVASVSILCQDSRVFKAMEMAGTPCPIFGKVGKEATAAWAKNKMDRPDYKELKATYISRCKTTRNSKNKKKSGRTCAKEFTAQ